MRFALHHYHHGKIAEIETLLTKIANSTTGTSDADVQAAVASIRDLIASNKAEVDKAKAAVPA